MTIKGGISVKNAGVVLLNTYIPMLFERLGLVADSRFLTPDTQAEAVHYLQYTITGLSQTNEVFLTLNKVLCGIPLTQPIPAGITISPANVEVIEGLISAMVSHWAVIGKCSVDGFRGTWLVRDGLLTEYEDKWQLTVEKRPYDVLLSRSPFSFSNIKYPWMDKPLLVQWPY